MSAFYQVMKRMSRCAAELERFGFVHTRLWSNGYGADIKMGKHWWMVSFPQSRRRGEVYTAERMGGGRRWWGVGKDPVEAVQNARSRRGQPVAKAHVTP